MPYVVKVWIPVNEPPYGEELIHEFLDDAEMEMEQAELMQPENKYEIVEVDPSGLEVKQ